VFPEGATEGTRHASQIHGKRFGGRHQAFLRLPAKDEIVYGGDEYSGSI
jgi:hypothetical protein